MLFSLVHILKRQDTDDLALSTVGRQFGGLCGEIFASSSVLPGDRGVFCPKCQQLAETEVAMLRAKREDFIFLKSDFSFDMEVPSNGL